MTKPRLWLAEVARFATGRAAPAFAGNCLSGGTYLAESTRLAPEAASPLRKRADPSGQGEVPKPRAKALAQAAPGHRAADRAHQAGPRHAALLAQGHDAGDRVGAGSGAGSGANIWRGERAVSPASPVSMPSRSPHPQQRRCCCRVSRAASWSCVASRS